MNDVTLSGQHALVTGGSRGIGAAISRRLAQLGASVTIVARDLVVASQLADEIGGAAVSADVTEQTEVDRAFAEAASGGRAVDILINNMGAVETAPFMRTDPQLLQRMFDANVSPLYLCTQRVVPGMLDVGAGRIVNVASTAGLRGYPYVSAYVAAKHAVVGLTRALAAEFDGKNITVNAVCPGFADTDMTRRSAQTVSAQSGKPVDEILAAYAASNPHGRLVRPAEVAERVAWFCLPKQSATSGRVVAVDGSEAEGDA